MAVERAHEDAGIGLSRVHQLHGRGIAVQARHQQVGQDQRGSFAGDLVPSLHPVHGPGPDSRSPQNATEERPKIRVIADDEDRWVHRGLLTPDPRHGMPEGDDGMYVYVSPGVRL